MREEAALEQWEKIYEVASVLTLLQPWEVLKSDEPVMIMHKDGRESVCCSVMGGTEGEHYGIRVFKGGEGLEDFEMLQQARRQGVRQARYAIGQMSCLEFAYTDREDVYPAQRRRIKELNLKYRGRGCWPVFCSRKRRYAPCDLDRDEALEMRFALENMVMVVRAFLERGLKINWKAGEMVARFYRAEDELWYTIPMPRVKADRQYPTVQLTDELFIKRLQKEKKNGADVLLDFIYLNEAMREEGCDRPVRLLLFVAADRQTGMILDMSMVPTEQSEAEAVMEFFLSYVMEHGCMRSVTARNLWILSALKGIAESCKIRLLEGNDQNMRPLDMAVDELIRDMMR